MIKSWHDITHVTIYAALQIHELTQSCHPSNSKFGDVLDEVTGLTRCTHVAVQARRLPGHALDHHGDGHSRREAVGVEQDVGNEPRLRERQVLRRPLLGADALLPGAGRELVAHCWVALRIEIT